MYYIKDANSNQIIYHPGNKTSTGYNIKLTETLNDSGQLTFTLPPINDMYDDIIEGKTKVDVYNDDDEIIWRGFVESTRVNFRKEKVVTCIGELSYLTRTIIGQKYNNTTATNLLNILLNNHNLQSDEQFTLGNVDVTDSGTQVHYFDFNTTLDAIRDKVCDGYGGYLKIRWENGVRYLDVIRIEQYGTTSTQPIQFGYNLMDYVKNISTLDIYSQVYPRGARLDEQKVTNLDAYVTIETVNGGVPYIENQDLIDRFGCKMALVNWDDVTDANNLKTKATTWLNNQQLDNIQLELKAVDISAITKTDRFKVGDMVHVVCDVYGVNLTLPIMSTTLDLQNPSNNIITVGNDIQLSYTQMNTPKTPTVLKQHDAWSGNISVGGDINLTGDPNTSNTIRFSSNNHNSYFYGGNDGSNISIGCWDGNNSSAIWRYNDVQKRLYLEQDTTINNIRSTDLFYVNGNTVSFTQCSCGHVTTSGTEFVWYITLPKSMRDVNVTDNGTTVQVRHGGKYLHGTNSAIKPSSWTGYGASGSFTITKITDNTVKMVVKVTTKDTNTVNNDLCSFNCTVKLKFT